MKNNLVTLLLFTSLISVSITCSKFKSPVEFSFKINYDVEIPKIDTAGVSFEVITPSIPTNMSSIYSSRNTTKDKIKKITLSSHIFSIVSPQGGVFDFLKSLEVYILKGQKETLLSKKDIIDKTSNKIEMKVSGENIKDYISGNDFRLRLKIFFNKKINTKILLTSQKKFLVEAELL